MTGHLAIRHDRKMLRKWRHKWFGVNRGTHWSIAGSVAVIILGSYLIYNNHERKPGPVAAMPGAEPTVAPMTHFDYSY